MDYQIEIARAAECLARGGVVAIPTDTLYGLAADAANPQALERVYVVKGRPADLPLPLLVSGWEQAAQVVNITGEMNLLARKLTEAYWPGSLTLVLPAPPGLPARLTGGRDTIAVRMPNHPAPLALASALGRPITGTSANRSGEADITELTELRRRLGALVDDIIASGPKPQGTASTIVALSAEGISLLREGALPYDAIMQTAGLT